MVLNFILDMRQVLANRLELASLFLEVNVNNIVFIKDGIVIEVIVTDEALENKTIEQIALESTDVPINDILINVVTPKEPIESWYIEDGEIKNNKKKLSNLIFNSPKYHQSLIREFQYPSL